MSEVKELMRTKSQKLLGMVETALKLPVTLERQMSKPENGRLLSRSISRKETRKEEEEYEAKFTGESVELDGKVKYEDLLQLLSCVNCTEMVDTPVSHCRKGHLCCSSCRANMRTGCKVCKQTMVENPNIAMDRLLSFIALPCKFG